MLLLQNLSSLFIASVLMITTLVWPCFKKAHWAGINWIFWVLLGIRVLLGFLGYIEIKKIIFFASQITPLQEIL